MTWMHGLSVANPSFFNRLRCNPEYHRCFTFLQQCGSVLNFLGKLG